jgi:hypothetical protein
MPHVLASPGPLSARARSFLARQARQVTVGHGPSDEQYRADMRAVFGYCDDEAITTLRTIQQRYSGLTYDSPFIGDGRDSSARSTTAMPPKLPVSRFALDSATQAPGLTTRVHLAR